MYTEEFRDKYIDTYMKNGFSIIKATKTMGIHYNTHKLWMKEPEFVKKFKEAQELALLTLVEEDENTHRILRLGIPKKNKKGELIGWNVLPYGRGIEWHLERLEAKYNKVFKVEHSGDVDFSKVIKDMLTDDETDSSDSSVSETKDSDKNDS